MRRLRGSAYTALQTTFAQGTAVSLGKMHDYRTSAFNSLMNPVTMARRPATMRANCERMESLAKLEAGES